MALATRAAFRQEFDIRAAGANPGNEYTDAHANDPQIDRLVDSVSDLVKRYCDQSFEQATFTQKLRGSGNSVLVLPEQPVTSITSIHESTTSPRVWDSTTLIDSDDYVLDEDGMVHRVSGIWSPVPASVQVVYVAGFASIPGDLERAVLEICRTKLRKGKDDLYSVLSQTTGEGVVTVFKDSDIPMTTRKALNLFRRVW